MSEPCCYRKLISTFWPRSDNSTAPWYNTAVTLCHYGVIYFPQRKYCTISPSLVPTPLLNYQLLWRTRSYWITLLNSEPLLNSDKRWTISWGNVMFPSVSQSYSSATRWTLWPAATQKHVTAKQNKKKCYSFIFFNFFFYRSASNLYELTILKTVAKKCCYSLW